MSNIQGQYFLINGKWYKNSWKEFNSLKNIDPEYYSSNFYDTNKGENKLVKLIKVLFANIKSINPVQK